MKKIFLIVMIGTGLFASEVSFAQSDFVERLINFVIFFVILWYFGASKIKQIFVDRREKISQDFNKVQEEEQHIKREKEKTKKALEDAKSKAGEIIALAKKDSYLIAQKYEEKLDRDIKMIVASNEQKLELLERMMMQDEISKSLDVICENLTHNDEYYAQVIAGGIR